MTMTHSSETPLFALTAAAYDGQVSSSLPKATFTRMQDGTAEEYAVIHEREAAYNPRPARTSAGRGASAGGGGA
jgi:hypothetical protein